MTEVLLTAPQASSGGETIPVFLVAEGDLDGLSPFERGLAATAEFKGKAGQLLAVPGPDGKTARVLFGLGDPAKAEAMLFRGLASRLTVGDYRLEGLPAGLDPTQVAVAFALGGYRFDRYRKKRDGRARLVAPDGADVAEAREIAHACALARDMVNTPANDMGPLQIETIAREIAGRHGATVSVVAGDDLLEQNYPSIHAVGRAADPARAPRIVELGWGRPGAPLVALVGKGVV
ncbi:MAG: leucyl aminopeptidase family protein, partial [Caulobacter sp.]